MESILRELKSNVCPDNYEYISLITYLANLTEQEILSCEIEAASNILHCAFKNLYVDHYNTIQNILNEPEPFVILSEKTSGSSFKIFIKDTWLFRMILINSFKYSDIVNKSLSNNYNNLLVSLVDHILNDIVIVKPLSLHLLRTLLFIVTKRKDILSPNLSQVILRYMNQVALSPITIFRQYAREISKAVISYLPEEDTIFLDVSLFPIKGIDIYEVVKRFPKSYIRVNQCNIIKKVLRMFHKNVESKDGGALYECFASYSFEEWKSEIWPLFLDPLKYIDYEGEFFQSLLKYWITSNVCTYKNEFYYFMRDQQIDWKLKGYILLECRKKGCALNDNIVRQDILTIFYKLETRDLGLKLAMTYNKKTLWPETYEIEIILNYLYSNTNVSLEEEETKSLRLFISQIFLHAHNELKKNETNFPQFKSLLNMIYKYCRASLKTDYSEVGTEIVFLLWTIAAGCHKDLLLNYKLEKKDYYSRGENLFYKKLIETDTWCFGNKTLQQELIDCFCQNNGSSIYITRLFTKYIDATNIFTTTNLKNLVAESLLQANIDIEKRIKNYSEIIFQNQCCKETSDFLSEINNFMINLNLSQKNYNSQEVVFTTVLYLEIIMVAMKYNKYDVKNLNKVIENLLIVAENIIITNNSIGDMSYKTIKILEAFINKVMLCLIENSDILWETTNKENVINHLIMIIQRSNMKRPLSLSVEVLKHFGSKMNENDLDRTYKIQFLSKTLESLYETSSTSNSKIRRSPQSRLVIHAMCSSDMNPNKSLLKWVMTYLLKVISDRNAPDSTVASALHSIEILISDNSLQSPTLPFISDIIIQCVELFAKPSWIIRNADLQLTRGIIDRFYGVCLDICNRPKCVEDLFMLFPGLSSYFYEVLSSDKLDERAVLVFQFFCESQVKEHIFISESTKDSKRFLQIFLDILQIYPNHYGKMAARSYSALCTSKGIPHKFCSIIRFFKTNYKFLTKNIVSNFIFLIGQLYEKYKNSFQYCINENSIDVMNFAIKDLLSHLRRYNTELFDFILFKIKPPNVVLDEFMNNLEVEDFRKRLWLHNNIPFLLINTKPKDTGIVLNKILSKKLLSCIQIKILTILVSKFENNEFRNDVLNEIIEILFEKSFLLNDNDNYLLNCYFKTILVFYQSCHDMSIKNYVQKFEITDNIYKTMILVLYFSSQLERLSNIDQQLFYNCIEKKYFNFISFNEEIRNDIISTLPYLEKFAPKEFQPKILQMIFYSALFVPTYLEAYSCVTSIKGKSYCSILNALKDFFSVHSLTTLLKDKELVLRFFTDIAEYVPKHVQQIQSEGYYSEESDILVPKLFLERLINREIQYL